MSKNTAITSVSAEFTSHGKNPKFGKNTTICLSAVDTFTKLNFYSLVKTLEQRISRNSGKGKECIG